MNTPITIAELLRRVREAVTPWASANKGAVEIAADPWNVLELLAQRPGGFRVILLYAGKNKRGEHEEARVVDARWQIVLTMGRALTRHPGQLLADGASGARPLFELLDEMEDVVSRMELPDGVTEITPDFLGDDKFTTPEGIEIDGYVATFQVGMVRAHALPPASSSAESESSAS